MTTNRLLFLIVRILGVIARAIILEGGGSRTYLIRSVENIENEAAEEV